MENASSISVTTLVHAPLEQVWNKWTNPEDIVKWNYASSDWHTPRAENDLRPGGRFLSRMEAKDGSFGFDFGGVYDEVIRHERIAYTLGDGRKVSIEFRADGEYTEVTETFEAEQINPVEAQRNGWKAILENFRKYAEKE